MSQTSDGGYVLAGASSSNDIDGDVWVVKLSSMGVVEWESYLGGTRTDYANSITQTSDGGYVLAGYTQSNDGDVSGIHNLPNTYFPDAWIVKLNQSGILEWQKCLGGTHYDFANAICQTVDGGFIIAAQAYSNNGDVIGFHGGDLSDDPDFWVVKLDSIGNIVWQQCLGGTNSDVANSVQQTNDGGYIVSGSTSSTDGDVLDNHGTSSDYWIIKFNSIGNVEWKKCYGSSGSEESYSIDVTLDEGFVVAGLAWGAVDGDVSGWYYELPLDTITSDAWVLRLDYNGNLLWQDCLGGYDEERAFSVKQTNTGSFIVAVTLLQNEDGVLIGDIGSDICIYELTASGSFTWRKCIGGDEQDAVCSVLSLENEEFIIAGTTYSNNGDVNGNHGLADAWVVKLSHETFVSDNESTRISIFPNPADNYLVIQANEYLRESHFVISDIMGNEVISGQFSANSITLSLQDLAAGIYTLTVGNRFVTRIVKE